MEVDVQRLERIMAPVHLVWEEMDSLDQILAKTPQISDFEVVPGGRTARGKAKLAWGPIKWTADLVVEITELVPQQRISFAINGPALDISSEATVELTAVSDTETKLEYRGHIDVRHRLASRMKGLFNEVVEDHAHSLVDRVKVRAEQRRLAQERLLK